MKANVFLRKKGLNHSFRIKGSDFDGTLLELLSEYNSTKVVENINYDTVLEAVNCEVCGTKLSEQEKEGGNCCDACWLRN